MSQDRYEEGDEGVNGLGGHQRDLLYELANRGGTCGLATVARALAMKENGTPTTARTRRIYTRLQNGQLADLVDAGLVQYCEKEGVVELTARGRTVLSNAVGQR